MTMISVFYDVAFDGKRLLILPVSRPAPIDNPVPPVRLKPHPMLFRFAIRRIGG